MNPRTRIPRGILLIDKPPGITSFGVVRMIRTRLGVTKAGHAGTLDPMATGLLIVGVGKATKLLGDFLKLDKEYEAEILLGVRTETGDGEGRIIDSAPAAGIAESRVRTAIQGITGTWELPVPAYSAVKVKGLPLYKSARRGIAVVPPIKKMTVLRAEYKGMRYYGEYVIVRAVFCVESGTYIRSLAEEVGRRLGIPATIHALRRTVVGDFSVAQAEHLFP